MAPYAYPEPNVAYYHPEFINSVSPLTPFHLGIHQAYVRGAGLFPLYANQPSSGHLTLLVCEQHMVAFLLTLHLILRPVACACQLPGLQCCYCLLLWRQCARFQLHLQFCTGSAGCLPCGWSCDTYAHNFVVLQSVPSYLNSEASAYVNASTGTCSVPPANASFISNFSDAATGQVRVCCQLSWHFLLVVAFRAHVLLLSHCILLCMAAVVGLVCNIWLTGHGTLS